MKITKKQLKAMLLEELEHVRENDDTEESQEGQAESIRRSNLRQMVMEELALLREEDEKKPSEWQSTFGAGSLGPVPTRRANLDAAAAKYDEWVGQGGLDRPVGLGPDQMVPGIAAHARAALGQDVSDQIDDLDVTHSYSDREYPDWYKQLGGKDWKQGIQIGPPKRPRGETSPVDWADFQEEDEGSIDYDNLPDDNTVRATSRQHPGSRGVSGDIDWSELELYNSPNIQGVPDDMDVVPAPDGTWAVIPKRLQEAISLLRMNELAGVPKNKPRSPAPPEAPRKSPSSPTAPEAPKNPIRDTERNPPPGGKPKKKNDGGDGYTRAQLKQITALQKGTHRGRTEAGSKDNVTYKQGMAAINRGETLNKLPAAQAPDAKSAERTTLPDGTPAFGKGKDDSQGNPADENRVDEGEKWIQDAEEDIDRRGTEGVCTGKKFGGPTCREGTKRYNLAKTFRKMAKKRKGKKR